MNMDQALCEFGVRGDTLLSEEKHFLDLNGYLTVGNILTQEQIANLIRSVGRIGSIRERRCRQGAPSRRWDNQGK